MNYSVSIFNNFFGTCHCKIQNDSYGANHHKNHQKWKQELFRHFFFLKIAYYLFKYKSFTETIKTYKTKKKTNILLKKKIFGMKF